MPGHMGKINAVAFNADASVLASGKHNSPVSLCLSIEQDSLDRIL